LKKKTLKQKRYNSRQMFLAVSDMQFCIWDSAYSWNISAFYFTHCATTEINQFRQLDTSEFVLVFYFRFISLVPTP